MKIQFKVTRARDTHTHTERERERENINQKQGHTNAFFMCASNFLYTKNFSINI